MEELNNIIKKYEQKPFWKSNLIYDLNKISDLKITKDEDDKLFISIDKNNYYIEYEQHSRLISIVTHGYIPDSIPQVLPLSEL